MEPVPNKFSASGGLCEFLGVIACGVKELNSRMYSASCKPKPGVESSLTSRGELTMVLRPQEAKSNSTSAQS